MARAGLEVTHVGMVGPEGDFLVRTLTDSRVKTDRKILPKSANGTACIFYAAFYEGIPRPVIFQDSDNGRRK